MDDDIILGRLLDAEALLYCVIEGIDSLDSNESDQETLGMILGVTLHKVGFPLIDSYASAGMTAISMGNAFARSYFKCKTHTQKAAAIMAALKVAISKIEEGKIYEAIRLKTAELLQKKFNK